MTTPSASHSWREWEGRWYHRQPDGQWIVDPSGPPAASTPTDHSWRNWQGQWYHRQPDEQWVLDPNGPSVSAERAAMPAANPLVSSGWREWNGQWYQQQPDGQWVVVGAAQPQPAASPRTQIPANLSFNDSSGAAPVDLPIFHDAPAPSSFKSGRKPKKTSSAPTFNPMIRILGWIVVALLIILAVISMIYLVLHHGNKKTPPAKSAVAMTAVYSGRIATLPPLPRQ